ncbi:hypothetical protein U1E44_00110 [Arenibacter sp. GZD96]|uniref:hypothetical protein n=1 Tax=Aurantibrevibacter litoralis TaxID=3106030 RepID=UPI002AFEE0D8|nr:hypothetical protein [Arenibacter sp. GZD-96]MEA1784482.1 hypothetical protein [Arenibacter sp. GZD-96]
MRNILVLCALCLFSSCDWFSSKEEKIQKLVDEELKSIDWNDVDQYPLFADCDETASKADQKICFESNVLLHFSMILQDFEFVLNENVNDTIFVDFLTDPQGMISVLEIEKNPLVEDQIPEFEAIVTQSLKTMPKVAPALKRGIPVSAKFRIPIVLNSN